MSAFMHDTAHIDALVHAALKFGTYGVYWQKPALVGGGRVSVKLDRYDTEGATRIGRILLTENARSMCARYEMDDLDNEADGGTRPVEYLEYLVQADAYEYTDAEQGITATPWRFLPAVALLKALSSYEYQSCEHDGWAESEAKSFCDGLRDTLIGALPGYDDADTWAIYPKVTA